MHKREIDKDIDKGARTYEAVLIFYKMQATSETAIS